MDPQKIKRVYGGRLRFSGYVSGLEKHLKVLYETMYPGHSFFTDRFRWRWEENPCLKMQMVNIWDGDLLVAHETTNAAYYYRNGKKEIWGLSGTTVARENYPGMKVLLTDERKRLCPQIEYCIGFPNANMYHIAKNLNDNQDVGGISYYYISPKASMSDSGIQEISYFSEDYAELDESLEKEYSFFQEHSSVYLQWRFMQKPNSGYRVFELKQNGRLQGYAVLNVYSSGKEKHGQIIDILALSDEAFHRLIWFAVGSFYELGCDVCKLWMTGRRQQDELMKMGFQKSEPKFHLISTLQGLELEKTYITMAISDVF